MPHTSNCLFLLCSSVNKKLLFQHICVPIIEEESVSIMSDESNRSGIDLWVEDIICLSCRKNHLKLPDIKSIWGLSSIELKGEKVKGQAWCYVLSKKEFKESNGMKS